MRNETLLKVIIGVFAIILIILGTFVYGNFVRNKQTAQNNQANKNEAAVEKPNTVPEAAPAPAPAAPATTPAQPATTPAAPATTPVATTAHPKAEMPSTGGAQDGIIGATILAIAGYLFIKSRKSHVAISKSQR